MPKGPVLTVVITSVNEGLDKGLSDAERKIGAFGDKGASKLAKVAKVAAPIAGVTAVVAKLGSAADKAATSKLQFAKAMEEAGASADDLKGPINDAVKAAQAMAFSGGDARDALVALQTASGNTELAMDHLAIAQDVARLSGADLTVAADAIAKAYQGQDRALKALIPGIDATAKGTEAIAEAERLAAGQADIFAASAEGMGIKTKAALKGVAIQVGSAVAPAFKELMAALGPVVAALGELVSAVLPVLTPLLTGVAKIVAKLIELFGKFVSVLAREVKVTVDRITRAFELFGIGVKTVVEWVQRLIDKVKALLDPLNKAIGKLKELNPFKGQLGAIGATSSQVATQMVTPMATTAQGGGGVVINIYGDPAVIEARVTRALRDYARRNGVSSVFTPERT